jgi:hypothetical protein
MVQNMQSFDVLGVRPHVKEKGLVNGAISKIAHKRGHTVQPPKQS